MPILLSLFSACTGTLRFQPPDGPPFLSVQSCCLAQSENGVSLIWKADQASALDGRSIAKSRDVGGARVKDAQGATYHMM